MSRADWLRRDVAAYIRTPPTAAEMAIADLADGGIGDDTDWEALYANGECRKQDEAGR